MKNLKVLLICLVTTMGINLYSSEDSLYDFLWLDPDKSVYVLQNKLYKKKNSIFLELDGSIAFGDEFLNTHSASLKLGYYFAEEWGLELFGTKYFNSFAFNYNEIKRITGITPFLRRPEMALGAMLLWTPFYGKINTFNKIFYFDWGFGLGGAYLQTASNLKTVGDNGLAERFDDETQTAIAVKTDFKVRITKNWHLNTEIKIFWFTGDTVGKVHLPAELKENLPGNKKITDFYDFMIGIGYTF